jgi:hypothetical protein
VETRKRFSSYDKEDGISDPLRSEPHMIPRSGRPSTVSTSFPQHKIFWSPYFPGSYRLISLQRKSNLPAGESSSGAFERIGNEDREWRQRDSYNVEYRKSEEKRGPSLRLSSVFGMTTL